MMHFQPPRSLAALLTLVISAMERRLLSDCPSNAVSVTARPAAIFRMRLASTMSGLINVLAMRRAIDAGVNHNRARARYGIAALFALSRDRFISTLTRLRAIDCFVLPSGNDGKRGLAPTANFFDLRAAVNARTDCAAKMIFVFSE